MAAQKLDAAAGAVQFFRKKFYQRLVGGGIHGRGGDFDF